MLVNDEVAFGRAPSPRHDVRAVAETRFGTGVDDRDVAISAPTAGLRLAAGKPPLGDSRDQDRRRRQVYLRPHQRR